MRKRRLTKRKTRQKVIIATICLMLIMVVGYAAFQTNINITAKGNIKEKSRVIQRWSGTDTTDFHSTFYKENIVSATFLDNADVPNNATESWNVSEDKTHGGVMAWVIPSNEDNTKYDLYVGAKDGVIANVDSGSLFRNFIGMSRINFNNNFDTTNVTRMPYMFDNCTNLSTIDLSSFNTKKVTKMDFMFNMFDNETQTVTSNKLNNIIFGENWSVENVTNMMQLFAGCYNLTNIDVANWDTSNVINMASVFAYCRGLKEIDVSHWNTSKVQEIGWLFMECNNLEFLDLSNFDTRNVTNMRCMFQGTTKLKNLDLCSFDTKKVTNMYAMFYGTTQLQNISVGLNWTMDNVTNSTGMFTNSGVSEVTTGQC